VRHASRSSGLLHVEVSRARVSQFGLKTGRGVTTGGARGTIAEVASSGTLCQNTKAETHTNEEMRHVELMSLTLRDTLECNRRHTFARVAHFTI
jgi:hypothetical protein